MKLGGVTYATPMGAATADPVAWIKPGTVRINNGEANGTPTPVLLDSLYEARLGLENPPAVVQPAAVRPAPAQTTPFPAQPSVI